MSKLVSDPIRLPRDITGQTFLRGLEKVMNPVSEECSSHGRKAVKIFFRTGMGDTVVLSAAKKKKIAWDEPCEVVYLCVKDGAYPSAMQALLVQYSARIKGAFPA